MVTGVDSASCTRALLFTPTAPRSDFRQVSDNWLLVICSQPVIHLPHCCLSDLARSVVHDSQFQPHQRFPMPTAQTPRLVARHPRPLGLGLAPQPGSPAPALDPTLSFCTDLTLARCLAPSLISLSSTLLAFPGYRVSPFRHGSCLSVFESLMFNIILEEHRCSKKMLHE